MFQRADSVAAGWAAMQPLLGAWSRGEGRVDSDAADSAGPDGAHALLARDGHHWFPLDPA